MEKKEEKKIDPIVVHIGDVGPFQFWFFMLIVLSKFATGWVTLSHIFIAAPTTYYCVRPPGDDGCAEECLQPEHNRTIFTETVVTEFNLVCDRAVLVSFSQSMVMTGVMVGSIVFGTLSDNWGRCFAFTAACIMQLVCGLIVSLSPNYWFYVVFRFLTATALGGAMVTSFVLIMELIGVSYRELFSIIYQLPFNIGHATLPVFSYFLRDWRYFNLSYSSFNFIYLIYLCLCIESPRWLFSQGRLDESIAILERIAKYNGRSTENIKATIETGYATMIAQAPRKKGTILDLFRWPNLRKKTIIMCFEWLNVCMVYYGTSQYISTLSGNIFINVFIGGVLGIPGTLICILMTKYMGRRLTLITSNAISAFGLLSIAASTNFLDPVIVVAFATVGLFGASITFPNVYLYGGELFPTVVRNSGVGLSSFIGRFGSIIAPYVSDLHQISSILPSLIFGTISLIGCILTFFLPETRGFTLPETIEDGENFGKKQKQQT